MKRLVKLFLAVCALFIIASLVVKPVIKFFVRQQLEQVFVQSQVSVAGCTIRPGCQISLYDLRIKRQASYEIAAKEVSVSFPFSSILKPYPLAFSLKDVQVNLSVPKKNTRECAGFLKLGPPGPPLLNSIQIDGMGLDIRTLDLALQAMVSVRIDVVRQAVDYFDGKINSLNLFGLQLQNGTFKSSGSLSPGELSIAQLKYDKLKVSAIKGKMRLSPLALALYDVSAKALGGNLEVSGELKIGKDAQYAADLRCAGLDIEQFVHSFDLQNKFTMTGKLSGSIKLQGSGSSIELVGGELATLQPGGVFTITDTKFLENMAVSTKQSVDLLVESFKDYRYNTGVMSIGVEEGSIVLRLELEGLAGKRELKVVIHTVSIGGQKK